MKQTFLDKVKAGELALGTVISFTDPTVTEALADDLDFLWVDAEHQPFSLETIQAHVMAAKGGKATMMVRVAYNDPVLIKPVLDLGADGVIVPLIRTRQDAELAVAATHYPPEGIRGFGPRRPSRYGRIGGPDWVRATNESIITIVQIEHTDAVANIEDILEVPGLSAIVIGPNDLAASMGFSGSPRHPDAIKAAQKVIDAARKRGIPVGLGMGDNAEQLAEWAQKGVQWLAIGADFIHMVRGVETLTKAIRARLAD